MTEDLLVFFLEGEDVFFVEAETDFFAEAEAVAEAGAAVYIPDFSSSLVLSDSTLGAGDDTLLPM